MNKTLLSIATAVVALCYPSPAAFPQAFDPGEDISLIAHYPLTDDFLDQQRNHFHGAAINDVTFVYDANLKKRVANFAGGPKGAGSGSAVRLPANALDSVKEKQTITVATWVYYTNPARRLRIFDFGQDSTSSFYMTTRHTGRSYSARYTPNGTGSEQVAASGEALPVGSWQHCAVTVSGPNGTMTLYLNGSPVGTTAIRGTLSTALGVSPGNLLNGYFLGRSQFDDRDFEGRMSDFRIYDRPLSEIEVRELYDSYFDDETVVGSVYNSVMSGLGTLTNRTADLPFPTALSKCAISWNSSNTALVDNNGAVRRPPNTNPNQTESALVSVTVKRGEAVKTGAVNVTVLRMPNDMDIVTNDLAQLAVDSGPLFTNMALPTTGSMGSRILWASNAPRFLTPAGVVTRPGIGAGHKAVTLTATARYGKASQKKTFNVLVAQRSNALELIGVEDISFVSPVNNIPDLPYYVNGVYAFGKTGPQVRVLWTTSSRVAIPPSSEMTNPPTNANDYAKAGVYTIKGRVAGTNFVSTATVTVVDDDVKFARDVKNLNVADSLLPRPVLQLNKFKLSDVVLNAAEDGSETVFQRNQNRMIHQMGHTNVDSFLWVFRDAFNIAQPDGAVELGVWDSRASKLRGHGPGHYMSALAQCYLTTKAYDQKLADGFLGKMNAMIDALREMQMMSKGDPTNIPIGPGKTAYDSDLSANGMRRDYQNWGAGFISGYPPDQFIMLENGAGYSTTSNTGIWAPYYTLHKILAGCLDIYDATGNKKALDIAADMGRWVVARLKKIPQATLNSMWGRYIAGEYGGMNETLAHLYAHTGDREFLDGGRLFDNNQFFFGWHANLNPGGSDFDRNRGLATNVDTMRTVHANQQLPQILGALNLYDQTLDPKYYDIVNHFWKKLYHSYTYSYGGTAGYSSNSECFVDQPDNTYGPTGGLPPTGNRDVGESCATYNINKITQGLFMHKPEALYMDFYERAFYNHTLSSINNIDAATSYHNPLVGGWAQSYGNPNLTGFSCCNGTGMEQHSKYQDTIFMHKGDSELYVNLYIPSTLNWGGLRVRLVTNYPNGDSIKLHIAGSKTFDMKLRIPYWASKGVTLKVNGETQNITAQPGSYITVSRAWNTGDVVELVLPMGFHLFETTNATQIASIFYGPVLLCGTETEQFGGGNYRPITLNGADLDSSFTRAEDANPYCRNLTFTSNGRTLKPMFDFGTERRMPYWTVTKEF